MTASSSSSTCPGVSRDSIDLDVERNVLTVRAERVARNGDWEALASERPRGAFSRQLVLGDNLDLDRIEAGYDDGVLRLVVPVAEKAKPRKIEIAGAEKGRGPRRADGLILASFAGSQPLRSVLRPRDSLPLDLPPDLPPTCHPTCHPPRHPVPPARRSPGSARMAR